MFNIQNISNGNLFCVLNIYLINKPKTSKNVSHVERFYIKSVQYIKHLSEITYKTRSCRGFLGNFNTTISKKETVVVLSGYFHFGKYHYSASGAAEEKSEIPFFYETFE